MNLTHSAMRGSVKVVAVGNLDLIARGRPAEFRHRGLTLATRPTAMAALLEVGRDPDSIVLVPTNLNDMPLTEFVDVLHSLAHVPVIAGIVPGCSAQAVSELFDHGISSTVALPTSPGRLADAVRASRAPEQTEELVIEVGNLTLDDARHRVTWFEKEVTLAPKNFEILRFMLVAHPRVIPLRELMKHVGDNPQNPAVRARVAIGRLRAAFSEAEPRHDTPIETVHRIGYRLRP